MGSGGCSNYSCIDIIGKIKDLFCSDSCCVGFASGPSESEQHAKKVAEELAEMKEKSEKTSREVEQKIMNDINRSMNSFIKEIEEINQQDFSGEKLNINIEAIRRKNNQLSNQVVGCVSKVMNTNLVQTNHELSTILEERDEKKRKENFSNFVERVQKQALQELHVKIENSVNEQFKMVSKEIKTRQKEIDVRMEESVRELNKIKTAKEKSETEVKKEQVNYMYQSTLCDLLLSEAEG